MVLGASLNYLVVVPGGLHHSLGDNYQGVQRAPRTAFSWFSNDKSRGRIPVVIKPRRKSPGRCFPLPDRLTVLSVNKDTPLLLAVSAAIHPRFVSGLMFLPVYVVLVPFLRDVVL